MNGRTSVPSPARSALRARQEQEQDLKVASAANDAFKAAIDSGLGDQDFAAVYCTISRSGK